MTHDPGDTCDRMPFCRYPVVCYYQAITRYTLHVLIQRRSLAVHHSQHSRPTGPPSSSSTWLFTLKPHWCGPVVIFLEGVIMLLPSNNLMPRKCCADCLHGKTGQTWVRWLLSAPLNRSCWDLLLGVDAHRQSWDQSSIVIACIQYDIHTR